MTDHNHFAVPTEQHLSAETIATITKMSVPEPPMLVLLLDVKHDDTGHAWRQEITFSAKQMVELTQLMVYSCEQVEVDWRPSDSSDFTPGEN